ncbi:MAG: pyridoxamine 5'-phosphate oxidase family protein [Blastocatellia bacterium]|nr:pyridoxamine 5'-phosphate oxidase family protein [Blastocatellia bacterium]
MIEVEDMRTDEINDLLSRRNYGHLGCAEDGQPYVVPVHYAYDEPAIYIYTTEGKKSEIVKDNPLVCLQVEEVEDNQNWKSVLVNGRAVHVTYPAERNRALELITKVNPTLTPAVSIRWMDSWVRENVEVILRIDSRTKTGRASVDRSGNEKPFSSKHRDTQ